MTLYKTENSMELNLKTTAVDRSDTQEIKLLQVVTKRTCMGDKYISEMQLRLDLHVHEHDEKNMS